MITFLPSCVFSCLVFLELCTGFVHCAPDDNDRPSKKTNLFLLLSIYAVCCNSFGELTKIVVGIRLSLSTLLNT